MRLEHYPPRLFYTCLRLVCFTDSEDFFFRQLRSPFERKLKGTRSEYLPTYRHCFAQFGLHSVHGVLCVVFVVFFCMKSFCFAVCIIAALALEQGRPGAACKYRPDSRFGRSCVKRAHQKISHGHEQCKLVSPTLHALACRPISQLASAGRRFPIPAGGTESPFPLHCSRKLGFSPPE